MKNQKGFSLIELLVVVIIIAIIAAIAIPSLLASRRAANQSSTVANLRTLVSAQATHASLNSGNYENLLADLATDGFIDTSWGAATVKNGYTYVMTTSGTDPAIVGYCVRATASAGAGDFSYATSHRGVIWQLGGTTAPACDPAAGTSTDGIVLGSV